MVRLESVVSSEYRARPMRGTPRGRSSGLVAPNLHSSIVNQAAGMVSVQADCMIQDALVLMSTRADESGITLDEIAAAVVDRAVRFG
jgi:hypothetical protein